MIFASQLTACFDEQYQQKIQQIKKGNYIEIYRQAADQFIYSPYWKI